MLVVFIIKTLMQGPSRVLPISGILKQDIPPEKHRVGLKENMRLVTMLR